MLYFVDPSKGDFDKLFTADDSRKCILLPFEEEDYPSTKEEWNFVKEKMTGKDLGKAIFCLTDYFL
jgi:hypothetical protein